MIAPGIDIVPDPTPGVGQHMHWPTSAFYWAVIDTASLPRRLAAGIAGGRREQLEYLFERSLPVPVEDIHTVYVRISGTTQFVACGCERTWLNNDEVPHHALTLTPAALPDWMDEAARALPPQRFNLLVGRFEPVALRKPRRRVFLELIAACILLAVVLIIGFERRIAAARLLAAKIETQRLAIWDAALVESATPATLAPEVRLTAELRTLRQTRTTDVPAVAAIDVSHSLTRLLQLWPDDVRIRTQSLSNTGESITLRGLLETVESSQSFIDAFRGLDDWTITQPTVRTMRDGIDMELRLTANKEGES